MSARSWRGAFVAGALLGLVAGAGCGGSGPSGGSTLPTGTNVATITVDAGPGGTAINLPFVDVTVCAPGTSNCQTIDHVLVDTGSTGLRIVASALASSVALPQPNSEGGALSPPVNPLYECMQFGDGYSWGSVRTADIQVADGTAHNMSIQLIGDPGAPAVPSDCVKGPPENTVEAFGANGVLGLAVFREDCGPGCATSLPTGYYACAAGGSCEGMGTTISVPLRVNNPVYSFATNNNGVVIVLPDPASIGQLAIRGALILGIDTQSNNQLGAASIVPVNPDSAYFSTVYDGQTLAGFIDSGSNALFFPSSLTACTANVDFYCPNPKATLSASNQGVSGPVNTVSFVVADIDALLHGNPTYSVFPHVAGINQFPGTFDWGLPFFYGRKVYVGFEGRSASAASGPFNAY